MERGCATYHGVGGLGDLRLLSGGKADTGAGGHAVLVVEGVHGRKADNEVGDGDDGRQVGHEALQIPAVGVARHRKLVDIHGGGIEDVQQPLENLGRVVGPSLQMGREGAAGKT